jgi:hypothetical protein
MPAMSKRSLWFVAVLSLLAFAPNAASAATKPAVKTGVSSNVGQLSARVAASIDPNGAATTYFFQYGPTKAYGMTTPEGVLTGDGNKNVSVDLGGLAAATRYHYRIVARNSVGQTNGADRTFTTAKEPLAIWLGANPNPLPLGSGVTLSGQVTGTGNAGMIVALESNPFPYTQGFKQVGNALVAGPAGEYSFALLSVPFATQYRVVQVGKSLTSAVVSLGVSARVSARVSSRKVRRGSKVTFSGILKPALPGTVMSVQRLDSKGRWRSVGRVTARTSNAVQAKFSRRVTIRSSGTYRVYAKVTDGRFAPSAGSRLRVRVR